MIKEMPKERKRLIWFLLISIFLVGFILINVFFSAGIIYTVISILSVLIILNWDRIPKKRKNVKLFGIQDDWLPDFGIGVLVAFGLMLLRQLKLFSFLGWAVPSFPIAATPFSKWITVVMVAPNTEEIFFRVCLFGILFVALGLSFFWSAILSSVGFSLYHIYAYAGELAISPILSVSGAFITAFLVGIILCYVNKWRGSITASIGTHLALNSLVILGRFVIVS